MVCAFVRHVSYRRDDRVTEDSDPVPRIDWTKVPFPSDRLTLGGVRKLAAGDPSTLETMVYNLVSHECEVAASAAALALKPPGARGRRFSESLLDENGKELASRYVEMGVAAGTHEATRLVTELIGTAKGTVRGRGNPPRR